MSLRLYESKNESIDFNDLDYKYYSYKLSYSIQNSLVLFRYPTSCLTNSNDLDKDIIIGNFTCMKELLSNIYFGVSSANNNISLSIERDDRTSVFMEFNSFLCTIVNKYSMINIIQFISCIGTVMCVALSITYMHQKEKLNKKREKNSEEGNMVSIITIKNKNEKYNLTHKCNSRTNTRKISISSIII